MRTVSEMVENYVGKGENAGSHNVFKSPYYQERFNTGLFGKGSNKHMHVLGLTVCYDKMAR